MDNNIDEATKSSQSGKIKITAGQSKFRPNLASSSSNSTQGSHSSSSKAGIALPPEEDKYDFGEVSSLPIGALCANRYGMKMKKRKGVDGDDKDENKKTRKASAPIAVPHQPEPLKSTNKTTGPRVEFVDGKMVIQESSLEIGQDSMYADDNYVYDEVEENENQSSTTYASFRRKGPSPRWGIEETITFYQCLRQCGLNFTLMQTFFPGRTRDSLKKKYHKEEKLHPELIEKHMKKGIPLDLEAFTAYFGNERIKEESDPKTSSLIHKLDPYKEEIQAGHD